MLGLSFLHDFRDIVVIVFGITGLVALLIFIIFTVLIGFTAWRLLASVRGSLRDGLGPVLDSAQETARGVQGTTEFFGDRLVAPVIQVYGVFAAVRTGVGVLARALGRKGRA